MAKNRGAVRWGLSERRAEARPPGRLDINRGLVDRRVGRNEQKLMTAGRCQAKENTIGSVNNAEPVWVPTKGTIEVSADDGPFGKPN